MTHSTSIETLLAKREQWRARVMKDMNDDEYVNLVVDSETQLLEAFREVLGALKFYSDKQAYIAGGAKTEGFISKVEADEWGSRAREALAKANEIASGALQNG